MVEICIDCIHAKWLPSCKDFDYCEPCDDHNESDIDRTKGTCKKKEEED